ncbi:MAG TPA: clan AA aspartic protease [Gemmataceae bacterium]|jgi:clan AA aspartic protease|nr:clan AA aspartic protease [Gemmataceae bacterium]
MTGVVRQREARIKLRVVGPRGQRVIVEAVIDTGYTGWLTLPPSLIATLRLPWTDVTPVILADGNEAYFDVFDANVIWNRRKLAIKVDQADATPLVGMSMLEGCQLKIDVRPGGKVQIKSC